MEVIDGSSQWKTSAMRRKSGLEDPNNAALVTDVSKRMHDCGIGASEEDETCRRRTARDGSA